MEPEARYRALLDSEAPADLWDAAMQGEVQREYLMYKCLNRSEAEGYEDEIEPYLDFRSSTGRCALVRRTDAGGLPAEQAGQSKPQRHTAMARREKEGLPGRAEAGVPFMRRNC